MKNTSSATAATAPNFHPSVIEVAANIDGCGPQTALRIARLLSENDALEVIESNLIEPIASVVAIKKQNQIGNEAAVARYMEEITRPGHVDHGSDEFTSHAKGVAAMQGIRHAVEYMKVQNAAFVQFGQAVESYIATGTLTGNAEIDEQIRSAAADRELSLYELTPKSVFLGAAATEEVQEDFLALAESIYPRSRVLTSLPPTQPTRRLLPVH
jgi:hypothetical protein